jgi:ABC-type transporter Mla subunit MlaD
MASWVLFGILIGIFLFSTTIVCWQLIQTILEVRGILKVVRGLTEEVQPTLHEVNEILRKTNLVMDEAGDTYQQLGENVKRTRSLFARLKDSLAHYRLVLGSGLQEAVSVYQQGEALIDDADSADERALIHAD